MSAVNQAVSAVLTEHPPRTRDLSDAATPRELVRRVIDRLEGLWWRSGAAPTGHIVLNQS